MYLYDVAKHLKRHEVERGLVHDLGSPADEHELASAEQRLEVTLPFQVREFYRHYNGLSVEHPPLVVLSLDQLTFLEPNALHFSTFDRIHRLCFDVSHLNNAGQWNVFDFESRYQVTLTMASFWSNKIWNWIDKHRAIWEPHPDS